MEQFYTVRIVFWRRPYPHTSLMRDRTAFVFVERTPLLRDGRGGSSRRRTTCPLFMPTAMPRYQHIALHSLIFFGETAGRFHQCIHLVRTLPRREERSK